MSNAHVIGRKVFELEFYSGNEAPKMQAVVSRIIQEKLNRILESALDKYSIEQRTVFLDQLQIDLGSVPYDEIELEFPERFQKELERILPELIENSIVNPGETNFTRTAGESMIDVFRQFINTGTVPWWLTESSSGYLARALNTLASQQQDELAELIRTDAKRMNVLRRIVLQFSDSQLETIVRVLEPADAAFIIAYSKELDTSVERKTIEAIRPGNKFRNIKWELIIGYLVSDRGSDFNRKTFLRFTIAGLASHYNISYSELLQQLLMVTAEMTIPVGAASSLPALLRALEQEEEEPEIKSEEQNSADWADMKRNPESETVSEIERRLFVYLLRHNSIPSWAAGTGRTELRIMIQKLLLKEPDQTLQLLAGLAHYDETVFRFVAFTDPQQWQRTVEIAEPTEAGNIGFFVNTLTTVSKRDQRIHIPEKEFNRSVWHFVLDYILRNYGTEFSSRIFVRTTLLQIANRYSIAYTDLLKLLSKTITDKKNSLVWSPSLAQVIRILSAEIDTDNQEAAEPEPLKNGNRIKNALDPDRKTTIIPASSASAEDEINKIRPGRNDFAETEIGNEINDKEKWSDENSTGNDTVLQASTQLLADFLFEFFSTGKIPWWAQEKFRPNDLNAMVSRLLKSADPVFIKLIGKLKKDEDVFSRFVRRISSEQVTEVLKLVSRNTIAESFQEWTDKLESVIAQKSGKPAKAKSFISRLQLRLLHRIPQGRESSFGFHSFIYELIGEIKSEYQFSVSEILMLMADAAAGLPASKRQKMLVVLNQMQREKGQLLYNEMAREENRSPDRILFDDWLKNPMQNLKNSSAQTLNYSETAAAWIEIAIANEKPSLPGIAGLSWKEIYETVLLLYPEKQEEYLPLLRKQFDLFSTIRAETIFPLPGFEQAFALIFKQRTNSTDTTALRQTIENWIQKQMETHPLLIRELFGHWLDSRHIRKQLAEQISNQTLSELLSLFSERTSGLSSTLIFDLFSLREKISSEVSELAEKKIVKEAALYFAARMKKVPLSSVEWIQSMLCVTGKLSGIDSHLLASSWKQFAMRYAHEWRSDLLLILDHLSDPVYLDRLGDRFLARLKKMEEEMRKENEEAERKKEKLKKPEDFRDRIQVKNAGLILLGPYLGRLFAKLNFVESNKFVSEEARQKAIAVLQFMADLESEMSEAELILNKILCGAELSEPIDKSIVPDENEKAVCEDLLDSVIKNWSVLGNTSIDTFRETFLRREGGILFANEKWELRVEQKAYDKLLIKLPWSFTMVRLPWMKNTIITEWKT